MCSKRGHAKKIHIWRRERERARDVDFLLVDAYITFIDRVMFHLTFGMMVTTTDNTIESTGFESYEN